MQQNSLETQLNKHGSFSINNSHNILHDVMYPWTQKDIWSKILFEQANLYPTWFSRETAVSANVYEAKGSW